MIRAFWTGPAWRRYLAVVALSVPFAFGLRAVLQQVLKPDIRDGAVAYVRERKAAPLSEPLAAILADPSPDAPGTPDHPLVGRPAPDFALPDDGGNEVRLADRLGRGPVVVVFYYGYRCSHCVAQLFALGEDAALFHELGAEVVAISSDPPEQTAAKFRKYGRFAFPVVSDAGDRVAGQYEMFLTADDGRSVLQHGTVVIAPDGRVTWAYRGSEPYLDNKALLREVARCKGLTVGGPAVAAAGH